MSLTNLPLELQLDIIAYLSLPSLSSLASTNRRFHHLITPHLYARGVAVSHRNIKIKHCASNPVLWAITHNRYDLLSNLLKHGLHVNLRLVCAPLKKPVSFLHYAVQSKSARQSEDTTILKLLLDHGAEVDARQDPGSYCTPLHWVVTYNEQGSRKSGKFIRLLLEYGADVNAWSHNGNTPLHWAAYQGNVEAVRVLLEVGAGINPGCKRETPLMMAIRRGYTEIEQMLREKGALTREEAFLVERDRRRRLL
jgi:hypothetical protein